MPPRKLVTGMLLAAGSLAGSVLVRRRAARKRERVDLYAEDGSMHSFSEGSPEALAPAADRARAPAPVNRDELGAALREAAYLEGDFLLRSGRRSKYYLDKYRFETRPDLLGPLGEAIAAAVARARAGRRAARGARARRRRARRRRVARGRAAVPDRPQGGEGLRHGQPARRRLRAEASASASSRTSSPPAARRSRRSRPCASRTCRSRTRSASSTARRAASTSWPATRCGCGRSSAPQSSWKWPQIRLVEPFRPMPLLGFRAKV